MAIAPGAIARNAKGERIQLAEDGQWHRLGATAGGGAKGASAPHSLTVQDRNSLNALLGQAASANETKIQYDSAGKAIKDFAPGPWKGAFYDAMLPQEGGGFMDKVGAMIGAPLRAIGALPQKQIDAYQRLKGLSSERVLEGQIAQKGPQTDSDAARLQLTEISPYKSADANEQVIQSGAAKADRAMARAPFYTQWANKYGLNGVDENGASVEQAFQAQGNRGFKVIR